jgi:hypothetical protein
MADLVAVLTAHRITYQRGATEVDSASLDTKVRRRLMATAGGEPLVIVEGTSAIANHVTAARPVQTDSTAATDLAKQRLVGERISAGIRRRQATLRSTAKIEYAKDFAPKRGS